MKFSLKSIFFIGFMFLMCTTFAQDKTQNNPITSKIYFYTFSGNLSSSTLESMQAEILKMQFVTEAKIEYKAEKGIGRIRILADEQYINQDSDFEFNIYNVKQLLIRNNATPNEYKWELRSK